MKKGSVPKCHELSIRYHFYMDFPMKMSKKLNTQMSQIIPAISFLNWFFQENVKKSSIPKCHEWSLRGHFYMEFSIENIKKSSIPKCHELSIRCHFYKDFSMKFSKKARYRNATNEAIFYMEFSMKMSKKARYPNLTN